jgi:hypothetical protein
MSRLNAAAGAAALVALALASTAEAGTITLGRSPGVRDNAGDRGGAFRTFAQERERYAAPGSRFNHVVGKQRGRGRNQLRSHGRNGAVNYDYTVGSGRAAGSATLQEAVWFLENQLGSTRLNQLSGQAQAWVNEADGSVDVGGDWHRSGNPLGDSVVLDPIPPSNGTPGNLVMVPLPPAALAGLTMLAGLGAARLRRRRAERKLEESL